MDGVDIADLYGLQYNFDDDESILESFSKIYKKHDIKYEPRDNTKFIRVRYLLNTLKNNDDVDTSLYIIFIPHYQKEINYIIKFLLIKMMSKLDLPLITL